MSNIKLSELSQSSSVASTDLVMISQDQGSEVYTDGSRKVNFSDFQSSVLSNVSSISFDNGEYLIEYSGGDLHVGNSNSSSQTLSVTGNPDGILSINGGGYDGTSTTLTQGDDGSFTLNNDGQNILAASGNGNITLGNGDGIVTIATSEYLNVEGSIVTDGDILLGDNQSTIFGNDDDYSIEFNGDDAVHTISGGDFVFTGGDLNIGTTDGNGTLNVKSEADSVGISLENASGQEIVNLNDEGGDGMLEIKDSAGTNKIRLFSDGNSFISNNLGIGTASPDVNLHVYDATANSVVLFESGDSEVNILLKDNSTAYSTALRRIANDLGILPDGGNVGIGTDEPDSILDIQADGDGQALTIKNSAGNNILRAYNDDDDGAVFRLLNSDGDIKLQLSSETNGKNYINNGGNVGIGTDSPDTNLHVYDANADSVVTFESGDSEVNILLKDNSTTYPTAFRRIANDLGILPDGGNVGIGTDEPDYTLDVNGDIHASGNLWVENLLTMTPSEIADVLTPSDTGIYDRFGISCSLSSDGSILAVGAYQWDGGGGDNQGAVYVYDWDGSDWIERSIITASDAGADDYFGHSCSLSGDGSILAVGANGWDGVAGSIQGAVYIYDWDGSDWTEQSIITASDAGVGDQFGHSCSLSNNGLVLAVGATRWDGSAGSDQGAVYIYDWGGSSWTERTTALIPSDAGAGDYFGYSCALSYDGSILAIGATRWDGGAGSNQGAVYIYDWGGSGWSERTTALTASDAGASDYFGSSCSLSDDGYILAVGASERDITSNDNQGAVYIYDWSGSTWSERTIITASDARSGDQFGDSCSLSGNGSILTVGATNRDDSVNYSQGGCYTIALAHTVNILTVTDGNVGIGTDSPAAALDVVGGNIRSITTKTNDYTITSSDYTILADATSNTVTLTLPASPNEGQIFNIKCINATYTVTVARNGNNIDGDASNITLTEDEKITIQSDGSDWWII